MKFQKNTKKDQTDNHKHNGKLIFFPLKKPELPEIKNLDSTIEINAIKHAISKSDLKNDFQLTKKQLNINSNQLNSEKKQKNVSLSRKKIKEYLNSGKSDLVLESLKNDISDINLIYGDNNPQFTNYYRDVIRAISHSAMKALQKNDMYTCFNTLFECLDLVKYEKNPIEPRIYYPDLHIIILNNLGCAYKRIKRNNKSFYYLNIALKLVFKHKIENLAPMTYINLSSITSQMGFHVKSLEFAKNALICSQSELLNLTAENNYDKELYKEKVHLVGISFFNIAVETEFLRKYEQSLEWYKKAYLFLEEKLGNNDPNIQLYKDSYNNAKEKFIEQFINPEIKTEIPKFKVRPILKRFQRKKFLSKNNLSFQSNENNNFNDVLPNINKKNTFYYQRKTKPNNHLKSPSQEKEKSIMIVMKEIKESNAQTVKINNYFDQNFKFKISENKFSNIIENKEYNRDEEIEKIEKTGFCIQNQNEYNREKELNNLLENNEILNWDGDQENSENEKTFALEHKQRNSLLQKLKKLDEKTQNNSFSRHSFENTNRSNNENSINKPNFTEEKKSLKNSPEKNLTKSSLKSKKQKDIIEKNYYISEEPDSPIILRKNKESNKNRSHSVHSKVYIKRTSKKNYSFELNKSNDQSIIFSDKKKEAQIQKIIIKVKDIDIQTDENPEIYEEHLNFEIENEPTDIIKKKYNKCFNLDFSSIEKKKISKIQRFYKKKYQYKKIKNKNERKIFEKNVLYIQRKFKLHLAKKKFEICKINLEKDIKCVKKRCLKLTAPPMSFSENYYYLLRVFVSKTLKSLNWQLYEFNTKKTLETFTDLKNIINLDESIDHIDNIFLIEKNINSLIKIIDIENNYIIFKHPNILERKETEMIDEPKSSKLINNYISFENIFKKNKNLRLLIRIQNKMKEKIANIHYFHKKTKKIILFTLTKKINDYYVVIIYYKLANSIKTCVTGRLFSEKVNFFNLLYLPQHFYKNYYGKICRENIFEIIEIDFENIVLKLTDDAKYRIELLEKVKLLKEENKKLIIDENLIKKIQCKIRLFLTKKKIEFQKMIKIKNKFKQILKVFYIMQNKTIYLVRIIYLTLENILIFKVFPKKTYQKYNEISQKLYSSYKINQLNFIVEKLIEKLKIEIIENNQIKIKLPRVEEILSLENKEIKTGILKKDKKNNSFDPLLETKIKISKNLNKTYLEKNEVLSRNLFDFKKYFEKNKSKISEKFTEIYKIIKIQRKFKDFLFRKKLKFFLSKKFKRNNRIEIDKFFKLETIKIIDLKQENNIETIKNKPEIRKGKIKEKDPYKKNIIMIRKLNHTFNKTILTKIKFYFHIYFNILNLEIAYKNPKRTQQITFTLQNFNQNSFKKSFFTKNFNSLILNSLIYSENEQTCYFIKNQDNIENIDPNQSPKSFKVKSPKTINPFLRKKSHGENTQIFLKKISKKIEDSYYKINFFIDIDNKNISFDAFSYEDPYQKLKKTINLPQNAQNFILEKKEDEENSKIKDIFSFFLEKTINNLNLNNENIFFKSDLQFEKAQKIYNSAILIQKIFRSKYQSKIFEENKKFLEKKKIIISRKFYKIGSDYADLTLIFYVSKKEFQIRAKNLSNTKKNLKIFKIIYNEKIETDKNNIYLHFNNEIMQLISVKIIKGSIFIVSLNEKIKIEETSQLEETDREYLKRKTKSSRIFNEQDFNLNKLKFYEKKKLNLLTKNELFNQAAIILQKNIRKFIYFQKHLHFKIEINQNRFFIMSIIEKIQNNYLKINFHYLKKNQEILINIKNINNFNQFRSYVINIQSISNELYNILENSKINLKKLEYYRNLFSSLIKFLWKHIDITFLYDKVYANTLDKHLILKDVTEINKKKKYESTKENKKLQGILLKYILIIQRNFRKSRTRYQFNLLKEFEKKRIETLKKYGKKIKKSVKYFNGEYYLITIYIKTENLLTFTLISSNKNKNKITNVYELDDLRLINTKGLNLIDFLLKNMQLRDGKIDFDTEKYILLNSKIINDDNNDQINQKLNKLINPSIEIDQSKIIHQEMKEMYNDSLFVFNIYYSKNKETIISEKNENMIQLEIDLQDLKKFNPFLNLNSQNSLKILAEQLTDCIRTNENGELMVDSNRMFPDCIKITEKNHLNLKNNILKSLEELKKYDRKQRIIKSIKFFNNSKYLIVVNYVERPIVTKKSDFTNINDDVYEDFEALFEIISTNLKSETEKIINCNWELPLQDAFLMSGNNDINETGKYLMDNLQLIGEKAEKIAFYLSDNIDSKTFDSKGNKNYYKNMVFIKKKVIEFFQNQFKNRNFFINYRRYYRDIQDKFLIGKIIFKQGNDSYIIGLFCYEKKICICAWNLNNFNKYEKTLETENIQHILISIKKKNVNFMKILNRYLEIIDKKNEKIMHFEINSFRDEIIKYDKLELIKDNK